MEPLRMFAVQSVQQAQTRKFEGQPYTPWENPYRHSLPPAPDVPKKPARPKAAPHELRQMIEQGRPVGEIAEVLGVTRQSVHTARYKMKRTKAEPAPIPVCLLPTPEPQRLHVLDWDRRMSRYEYSSAPEGCLPKKARKTVSSMTRGQMRDELRGHTRMLPLAINCAAPPARTPSPFD